MVDASDSQYTPLVLVDTEKGTLSTPDTKSNIVIGKDTKPNADFSELVNRNGDLGIVRVRGWSTSYNIPLKGFGKYLSTSPNGTLLEFLVEEELETRKQEVKGYELCGENQQPETYKDYKILSGRPIPSREVGLFVEVCAKKHLGELFNNANPKSQQIHSGSIEKPASESSKTPKISDKKTVRHEAKSTQTLSSRFVFVPPNPVSFPKPNMENKKVQHPNNKRSSSFAFSNAPTSLDPSQQGNKIIITRPIKNKTSLRVTPMSTDLLNQQQKQTNVTLPVDVSIPFSPLPTMTINDPVKKNSQNPPPSTSKN